MFEIVETDCLSFFVAGDPRPTRNILGKMGVASGVRQHVAKGANVRAWSAVVEKAALKYATIAREITKNGCALTLEFALPNPHGKVSHAISKPDIDNLRKPVQDALGKAGFWTDDCRVVGGDTPKFYAIEGQSSGVFIFLESADHYFRRCPPMMYCQASEICHS